MTSTTTELSLDEIFNLAKAALINNGANEENADAVATAKRDLNAGEMLDGEGGYCVWAKAIPASQSHRIGALPIGLAHHVKLKHPISKDQVVQMSH